MSETPPNNPFLSVVIPTFNRRDSLRVSLDGLARQTYPIDQFEVLVVSDGSTDGTDEWLHEYAAQTSFALRPFTQANAGPARARNRGIEQARGEVVVFLDDDVEPCPGFLAAHAAHHTKEDDKEVVIGPMSPDPNRRAQEPPWIGWEHAMLQKQYHNWRTGVWAGCGPHHFYSGNASLRRAHLLAVGGFDETFTRQEDVELAFRLERACGVRFLFDEQADGLHRPFRRFRSWLAVPFAYGRLDVVRARRGDVDWELVRHGYRDRNPVTRALASLVLAAPWLAVPLRAALRGLAQLLYRLHLSRLAFAALSVLYNVHYLEGVRAELGTRAELRRVIASPR